MIEIPLNLGTDRHHQEDTIEFDLASLKLSLGDVATLTLAARDNAGQAAASLPLQVLASPRTVDLDTQGASTNWKTRRNWRECSVRNSRPHQAKARPVATLRRDRLTARWQTPNVSRHFSAASELAALLRQSLLRTTVHSRSPEMSVALAVLMDQTQTLTTVADESLALAEKNPAAQESPAAMAPEIRETPKSLFTRLQIIAQCRAGFCRDERS